MRAEKCKKIAKRTYYLPQNLMDFFKLWKAGRDSSKKVAGALFFYMLLNGNTRELCEKLACSDSIETALLELQNLLKDEIAQIESKILAEYVVGFAEADAIKQKRKKRQKSSKSA